MNKRKLQVELSPDIRGWIDSVIVPALVKQYLAGIQKDEKLLGNSSGDMTQSGATPTKVIQ